MRKITKIFLSALIIITTFLGVNFSQKKINVSGEHFNVTLISLGTQAMAYCNSENGSSSEPVNTGICSGIASDSRSRCIGASSGTKDCVSP